jgi:hypothetical protein
MLPMRPMTPAHASIASLSIVLPDDAWPTMAKFRRSPAEGVAIIQICSCSLSTPRIRHERKLKSPTPTDYPRVGTRWIETDNNFSLQNLLVALFGEFRVQSDN